MKKDILTIDGANILKRSELKSISGASDGVWNGHGACYSDNDCPSYSSCDCIGRCISWTDEDYGDGLCN